MDEFDFSSHKVIEIPVTSPTGKKHVLREASGDAVARFNSARSRCMRFQDGGVSGVEGMGGLEMLLVSLCLFNVDEEGKPNLNSTVSQTELKSWPGRDIAELSNEAKKISEIDMDDDLDSLRKQYKDLGERIQEMEDDAAKNEPTSTEIG